MTQRKRFDLNPTKAKPKKLGPKAGPGTRSSRKLAGLDAQDPKPGAPASILDSDIQQSRKSESGGRKVQETTDNYEDYDDDGDDGQQEESSKMEDSIAKDSDGSNYSNDDFFDKEVIGQGKNAEEYFQELEEQKSRETPEGAQNSNADGGSIFNQTGGRFLNRT